MKVRLLSDRWDQATPKGTVRRFKGDTFSVRDDVAEWLIASKSAEPSGRAPATAKAAPEPEVEDVTEGLDDDLADESDEDSEGLVDDGTAGPGVERPAQSAPKADWVAYAVSRGVPAKEAESMDKPKLISRAG